MGSSIGEMLPLWQSHKRVRAARIISIGDGGDMLLEVQVPEPDARGAFLVKPAENMFARYRPVPGDYYVVYEDGYAAISPRAAFEGGYTQVEPRPRTEAITLPPAVAELPYAQRVLAELNELTQRWKKHREFFTSPTFASLPDAEQERMLRQSVYMGSYLDVLHERIAAMT